MLNLTQLDKECDRILIRAFDDKKIIMLDLSTKIQMIGYYLDSYQLSIYDSEHAQKIDKIEWLSGYIFIPDNIISLFRKGLITLKEVYFKSVMYNSEK